MTAAVNDFFADPFAWQAADGERDPAWNEPSRADSPADGRSPGRAVDGGQGQRPSGWRSDGPATDFLATGDERNYAMINHGVGLLSLPTGGVPVIGPVLVLVLWLSRKQHSPFLDDHGREATNFQLSVLLYIVGLWLFGVALAPMTFGLVLLPIVLLHVALAVVLVVGVVRGVLFARRGRYYRYPICLRMLAGPNDTDSASAGRRARARADREKQGKAGGGWWSDPSCGSSWGGSWNGAGGKTRSGPSRGGACGARPGRRTKAKVCGLDELSDGERHEVDQALHQVNRVVRRAGVAANRAAKHVARAIDDASNPRDPSAHADSQQQRSRRPRG